MRRIVRLWTACGLSRLAGKAARRAMPARVARAVVDAEREAELHALRDELAHERAVRQEADERAEKYRQMWIKAFPSGGQRDAAQSAPDPRNEDPPS